MDDNFEWNGAWSRWVRHCNLPCGGRLLEGPTAKPILRGADPDLVIKDHRGLRDAHLAKDEPSIVSHDADFAVMATAERAEDVAEVARVVRHPAAS